MKKMLFLLLLIPLLSFAQSDESIAAFLKSMPESLGRPVSLPQSEYHPPYSHFPYYRSINKQISFIYVVTTDSDYHKIFSRFNITKESLNNYKIENSDSFYYKLYSRYLIDSLPVFDFSKQELVLYTACGQCLVSCHHDGGKDNSCHRNACHLMEKWYVRDKEALYVKKAENN